MSPSNDSPESSTAPVESGQKLKPEIIVAIITGIVAIIVALVRVLGPAIIDPPPEPTSTAEPITSRYSFEEGVMGWVKQTSTDSQACVEVFQSDEKARDGRYSLAMRMDLDGEDPNNHKRKGEAWVDMNAKLPYGVEKIPVDLTNRTVTVQVYAPQGAKGDEKHPNGFQVFLKDEEFRSMYGPWKDVAEGAWNLIELEVTNPPSELAGVFVDEGFDPSRIVAVGVKMAAGDESNATYEGLIYLDRVDW